MSVVDIKWLAWDGTRRLHAVERGRSKCGKVPGSNPAPAQLRPCARCLERSRLSPPAPPRDNGPLPRQDCDTCEFWIQIRGDGHRCQAPGCKGSLSRTRYRTIVVRLPVESLQTIGHRGAKLGRLVGKLLTQYAKYSK